jgi:hypothetical protein
MAEKEPRMDISPFPSLIQPPKKEGETVAPTTVPEDLRKFIDENLKKEVSTKTRGERIKEEYASLEPTFRELLGDTKSDARTNALLLLADAGFKFASTYKPTMAMALGEAMSGLPRGFANIVAQARDRDIKIKTAALQQATDNVNMQDKIARDFQLEGLRIEGRVMTEAMKAKNARDLEILKNSNAWRTTVYNGDKELLLKQLEQGGVVEEDGGMGLVIQKTKGGSFIGSYIRPDKDGNPPPVVVEAVRSRNTLTETDNPYVRNRGPAPTTSVTTREGRDKLGMSMQSFDNTLRLVDDIQGEIGKLYTPLTWVEDKVNNIVVPLSMGGVKPNVNLEAAKVRVEAGLVQVIKQLAAANDQGRVAVYEQQMVEGILDNLRKSTGFLSDPELAASSLAALKTSLRNSRQQVLTQLGFVDKDLTMDVPALGTKNSPYVLSEDPAERTRMKNYLLSTFSGTKDPRASVYIQLPDGRVTTMPVLDIGKL